MRVLSLFSVLAHSFIPLSFIHPTHSSFYHSYTPLIHPVIIHAPHSFTLSPISFFDQTHHLKSSKRGELTHAVLRSKTCFILLETYLATLLRSVSIILINVNTTAYVFNAILELGCFLWGLFNLVFINLKRLAYFARYTHTIITASTIHVTQFFTERNIKAKNVI